MIPWATPEKIGKLLPISEVINEPQSCISLNVITLQLFQDYVTIQSTECFVHVN